MYQQYFGLKEEPFSIAVNPRYLFMSARHRDALAHLLYGVGAGGGFILLTGEVGTGKTTVNRCLLEQLPETTDIALILNPALNAVELLATVCDELNIAYAPGEQGLKVLTDKLHQFLLNNHANGRNTVLLIDEAQHLQFDVLEQIRLLTNLETNTKKLLQIILVGQPELRSLLNKPELRQLAQRITARYQLKPLNLEETQAYIRHRLQVAGLPANQVLFPKNVVRGIYKASRGIPRIINVLCDRMLLGTYGQNKTVVDRRMLKQSIIEVMGEEEDLQLIPQRQWVSLSSAIAVIVIVAFVWSQWSIFSNTNPVPKVSTLTDVQPPVVPVTSVTKTISAESEANSQVLPWFDSEQQAISELSSITKIPQSKALESCLYEGPHPRCERLTANTWQEFISYNRPAVLSLVTKSRLQAFAVVIAVDQQQALVQRDGNTLNVPLTTLGELWTGNFTLLWQPSDLYRSSFSKGFNGPIVLWLAQQFATLDQQESLLADQVFNDALSERVKIFQRNHQLLADGVVGLKTLLKLNEALGLEQGLGSFEQITQRLPNAAGTDSGEEG